MTTEQNKNESLWQQLPLDVQRARVGFIQERQKLFTDLMQRQVETIGKFLLLTNAGGAAAILAALATRPDLPLLTPLALYVAGIVVLGFALAASYYLYYGALEATEFAIRRHVADELDWDETLAALGAPKWESKFKRRLAACADLIYWASFALFFAGSVMGGIKMLC